MELLDWLGDSQLRGTLLHVRAQAKPVTADEVARALHVPRSAARWRLERLVSAGFLESAFARRTPGRGPGAGRPAKTYAPAAETRAIEFPRRHYETLVGLLAQALSQPRLAAVGEAYAGEFAATMRLRPARTVSGALERLCRGLGRLGFHAAVESVSDREAALVTATCPLRPLVVEHPKATAIDEGFWRGLVTAALASDVRPEVRCSTCGCFDGGKSCRVLVRTA